MRVLTLEEIRKFERRLDDDLASRPTLACKGEAAVMLAAQVIEHCHLDKEYAMVSHFVRAWDVLLPFLFESAGRGEPDMTKLLQDLHFAGHYFMLREYLYYTYNASGSFTWMGGESGELTVEIMDRTIIRQFCLQTCNSLVGSMEMFEDNTDHERIISLLKGKSEFVLDESYTEAWDLIKKEVQLKLTSYFHYLDGAEGTLLGKYTFAAYREVFTDLLCKALYHRYHSHANGSSGAVHFTLEQIATDMAVESGVSASDIRLIIGDISYGPDALKRRIQPMYYSLCHLPRTNTLVMMPHHFATWEGYINILRIVALRAPRFFLENISGPLAQHFTDAIEGMFARQGFTCKHNVSLREFDETLPDIDLVVISEEPTLGYVVFLCELKSPIPPQWAKDHLRVLNEDSVAKAFRQLDRIEAFIQTDDAVRLIKRLLPAEGHPHFPDEFVLVFRFLVITSNNAGMFFGGERQTVIDHQTLSRILEKCDGDIAYVMKCLADLNAWIDDCADVKKIKCSVGGQAVVYDGVSVKKLLGFAQNEYKSTGVRDQMVRDFVESGGHPFDVLPREPES